MQLWRSLPEALVRPGMVVMDQELRQHGLQMAAAKDQQVVEQLSACGAHPALGKGVGAWSPETADLQEEQNVQSLQPGRLDGKEVRGEQLASVLTDELPPRHPVPLGRRPQPSALEDQLHGSMRTAPAQFAQLTLDPPITPAGILPGQPKDQLLQLFGHRRSPKPLPAPGKQRPFAAHQFAMPPQQGLGRDQEGAPVRSRKAQAAGRQQKPIGSFPARTAALSFKDAELLPENQDL